MGHNDSVAPSFPSPRQQMLPSLTATVRPLPATTRSLSQCTTTNLTNIPSNTRRGSLASSFSNSRAAVRTLDTMKAIRHTSRLLRRPYSPQIFNSASRRSFSKGRRGVLNVALSRVGVHHRAHARTQTHRNSGTVAQLPASLPATPPHSRTTTRPRSPASPVHPPHSLTHAAAIAIVLAPRSPSMAHMADPIRRNAWRHPTHRHPPTHPGPRTRTVGADHCV